MGASFGKYLFYEKYIDQPLGDMQLHTCVVQYVKPVERRQDPLIPHIK
jgi:hypothetical protein